MPTPRAISASSTAARIMAPIRVRSTTSHRTTATAAGHRDDEDPVDGEEEHAELVSSREQRRHPDVIGIAAPDQQREVLEDQGQPHGGEHLSQLLPAQPLQKTLPLDDAQDGDDDGSPQQAIT